MPWTKLNYPPAMKNLAAGTRTKAIQIANAILKDKKKMKEGIVIATAIKQAEAIAAKPKVKKAASKTPVTKKKSVAKKVKKVAQKIKSKAATKTKSTTASKRNASNRSVSTKKKAASKVKSLPKKEAATVKKTTKVSKKISPPKKVASGRISKKVYSKANKETKAMVQPKQPEVSNGYLDHIDVPLTEVLHGENMHFIPEKGNGKPITTFESHQIQNVLHKREEVAFQQENKKVNQALASRKNDKQTYRHKGGR